jgi:hypothetical protein
MRGSRSALIVLVATTLGRAAFGDSICKPCPDGTTEVQVLIQSSDLAGNWYNDAQAKDFLDSPKSMVVRKTLKNPKNGGTFVVKNFADLKQAFKTVASKCQRIKRLAVFAHGGTDMGSVFFGNDKLAPSSLDQLDGLDCALADSAWLEFASCSAGRGCRGQDLMMGVASKLLKRGGSVQMNTADALAVAHFLPAISLNLDTQILTVDADLANPRWDNAPETPKACADRAVKAMEELSRQKALLSGCSLETPAIDNKVDSARVLMAKAKADQDALGSNRTGFGAPNRKAAESFHEAFRTYYMEYLPGVQPVLEACDEERERNAAPPSPKAPVAGVGD